MVKKILGEKSSKVVQVQNVGKDDANPLSRGQARTYVAHVPAPNGSLLRDGDTFDISESLYMRVAWIVVDVPTSVDYELRLDDSPYLVVTDDQGAQGADPVGDLEADVLLPVSDVQVIATNTAGGNREVRTRFIGRPG